MCKTTKAGTVQHFFTNFCVLNKFEELEEAIDSVYIVLAEEELENCIRPERRKV